MTALANVAAANSSSISIRARSPHPPASPEPSQDAKAANSKESIELAEIGQNAGASIRAASNTAGSSSETTPTTRIDRRKLNIHFAAMCFSLFLAGWNDGTTGPLLPRIQKVYHVGFAVVSLIFVFNCLGFITAAAANVALTDRLGFGKVMVLGSLCQMVGYALASPAPPFAVFVLGYAINGFGLALQDAGANGYVSSFEHGASTKMSIMHAVYGFGALCSPLVATQFSERTHWSYHYLISLSIAFLATVILIVVLRFRDQDECLAELGQATPEKTASNEEGKYKQIFRLRALHLLAVFIFIYVGVEVTIGGWIVTYVIDVRSGGPSSGYISSGFFGGLMLGRVALLWVNKTVGERYVIFLYVLLAIGLELVVWLVPSLIGGAVAVSFVGLLLGPIYPIVMNHSSRILPPWLLTGCIGWIAGVGQAGSAFLPFITGLLASKEGIKSLQPLLVSMMGFMVILWAVVPNHARRVD
ncbi:MFS general substrate transporter [Laetiporus sulphureus 93-53]|uniref:MFS general substrate transporter n=1 Tax=Laetiporus sulphureus 93-53 TaxID=1314785 RepID=A0A165CYV1_9APHY|nr:MFS general substrate transporter [Laetiporus sulphureus 93-53]KZT03772.1 MFS general substrate transporter [Laetiporus sulphureus 93-53]